MRMFRAGGLAVVVLAFTIAGCGSTKVVTRQVQPPLTAKPGAVAPPANEAPSCTPAQIEQVEAGHGAMGVCAPAPSGFGLPRSSTRGLTGPDVSNNDPFFNWHPVRSAGHPFGYVKVIQGTRFVDSTAAGMASAQRAASVIPGGYDFLEVCRASGSGEARLYASRLKAIGLVGHSFVPAGDAEWPLTAPCSTGQARAWLTSWEDTLHALVGRWPAFYTGAWWWNPNVGCWRPPHALRWVSGYTSRSDLSIPCGWGGVDLWQYTDAGFNGVSTTDMSRLEVPESRFLPTSAPSPSQQRAAKRRSLASHKRERGELHGDIERHQCRRGQHVVPREPLSTRRHLHNELCPRWIKRGGVVISVTKRLERELRARP